MARIMDKCRLCRRAGEKLFLKGERCFSQKCAMVRRPTAPGVHGAKPSRSGSEFGRQLAMKQKIKRVYGVMERQFRCHFEEASRRQGIVGNELLGRLERRLDNVTYRLGFAPSRALARQLVSHSCFSVNGRRMNIPSFEVKPGDVISVKPGKREKAYFKDLTEKLSGKKDVPKWLELDAAALEGKVVSLPGRDDVEVNVDPQLVVEYYSK
ncbi:MAG: 30S ribosomal protein S4 [Candidatus Moranbacteria bacterium]|nr:30S ribosomal protein S4 [Candidatus Moranbacteria bacterium]NTW89936.1 30S ribosomal protein S4 [Candidatus Moranbacteria bacterium]